MSFNCLYCQDQLDNKLYNINGAQPNYYCKVCEVLYVLNDLNENEIVKIQLFYTKEDYVYLVIIDLISQDVSFFYNFQGILPQDTLLLHKMNNLINYKDKSNVDNSLDRILQLKPFL